MLLEGLRRQVVEVGMEALRRGLVHGTAGNFSVRDRESGLVAISPSGMPYLEVTPADVVVVDLDGAVVDGARVPSSETPMHTMILRRRPDAGAVVHTHAHFSTVVGTIRPELPPILTEAVLVAGRVPVARYGLTGKADIGASVVEAMDDETRAVILKNHGLICLGASLDEALLFTTVVEEAARVYVDALAANGGREPDLVPEAEVAGMLAHFRATYGQRAG